MKRWCFQVVLLSVLMVLGFWGWHALFPSPEKVIRKRLGELAETASFSSDQGLVATAWSVSSLGEFFTLDVEVTVDVPGSQHTFTGRDELLQAAASARKAVSNLSVKFPDIKVTVAADKTSAVVYLTAQGKVSGQKDYFLQELRLRLIRVKRDWLINHVETVRTLSERHGLAPARAA